MRSPTIANAVRRTRRAAFARLAVVLALVAGGLVVGPAGACWACSCVAETPRQSAARADAVFVAQVNLVREGEGNGSSGDPVRYLATVEEVYKGNVSQFVAVDSAASGASCGLEGVSAGGRYLFFGTGAGFDVASDLCSGTRPLPEGAVLPDLGLGPATAPTPAAPPMELVEVPQDELEDDALGWWWAVALGVLLTGGAAFAIRATRRSER